MRVGGRAHIYYAQHGLKQAHFIHSRHRVKIELEGVIVGGDGVAVLWMLILVLENALAVLGRAAAVHLRLANAAHKVLGAELDLFASKLCLLVQETVWWATNSLSSPSFWASRQKKCRGRRRKPGVGRF